MSDDLNIKQGIATELLEVEKVAENPKQKLSLREFARRKTKLIIVFFAALIVGISFASYQASKNINEISSLYAQQTKLEEFKGSLLNVLLPLNNYLLVKNDGDEAKIEAAVQNFANLYQEVSAFAIISEGGVKELESVAQMMGEVSALATDITSGKIPYAQAGNLAIVAQSLVLVGQTKVKGIAKEIKELIADKTQVKVDYMVNLSIINAVLILGLLAIFYLIDKAYTGNIINYISGAAESVAESSEEILLSVDRQATASSTQAGTVVGVTEELGAMSGAAAKIAATATSVEKIANATSAAAVEGGRAVQEAIGHMGLIREEVTRIAEKVTDAGRKAEQILDSVDAIQEIADETHLLALNASIESAAAGEFGKRFSVVASEVRRLSERAREFTEEIQVVVNDVHTSTKDSIVVTQKGLEEVAKGVQIARRAGDALVKMQDMSVKTSHAVHTIAMATQRQSDNSQAFVDTMIQISSLLRESAVEMEQSRATAAHLNEVSDKLRDFV